MCSIPKCTVTSSEILPRNPWYPLLLSVAKELSQENRCKSFVYPVLLFVVRGPLQENRSSFSAFYEHNRDVQTIPLSSQHVLYGSHHSPSVTFRTFPEDQCIVPHLSARKHTNSRSKFSPSNGLQSSLHLPSHSFRPLPKNIAISCISLFTQAYILTIQSAKRPSQSSHHSPIHIFRPLPRNQCILPHLFACRHTYSRSKIRPQYVFES